MALIKCPECEKEISDMAVACPNCGCPISNNNFQANEPEIGNKIEDNGTVEIDEVGFGRAAKKRNKRKIAIILIAVEFVQSYKLSRGLLWKIHKLLQIELN